MKINVLETEMIELDKFMHVINYLVNEQIQEDHSPSSVSHFILKRMNVDVIAFFSVHTLFDFDDYSY